MGLLGKCFARMHGRVRKSLLGNERVALCLRMVFPSITRSSDLT